MTRSRPRDADEPNPRMQNHTHRHTDKLFIKRRNEKKLSCTRPTTLTNQQYIIQQRRQILQRGAGKTYTHKRKTSTIPGNKRMPCQHNLSWASSPSCVHVYGEISCWSVRRHAWPARKLRAMLSDNQSEIECSELVLEQHPACSGCDCCADLDGFLAPTFSGHPGIPLAQELMACDANLSGNPGISIAQAPMAWDRAHVVWRGPFGIPAPIDPTKFGSRGEVVRPAPSLAREVDLAMPSLGGRDRPTRLRTASDKAQDAPIVVEARALRGRPGPTSPKAFLSGRFELAARSKRPRVAWRRHTWPRRGRRNRCRAGVEQVLPTPTNSCSITALLLVYTGSTLALPRHFRSKSDRCWSTTSRHQRDRPQFWPTPA